MGRKPLSEKMWIPPVNGLYEEAAPPIIRNSDEQVPEILPIGKRPNSHTFTTLYCAE
jgi:hypothetical protein